MTFLKEIVETVGGVIGQAGSGDMTYQKEETAGAGCLGSALSSRSSVEQCKARSSHLTGVNAKFRLRLKDAALLITPSHT